MLPRTLTLTDYCFILLHPPWCFICVQACAFVTAKWRSNGVSDFAWDSVCVSLSLCFHCCGSLLLETSGTQRFGLRGQMSRVEPVCGLELVCGPDGSLHASTGPWSPILLAPCLEQTLGFGVAPSCSHAPGLVPQGPALPPPTPAHWDSALRGLAPSPPSPPHQIGPWGLAQPLDQAANPVHWAQSSTWVQEFASGGAVLPYPFAIFMDLWRALQAEWHGTTGWIWPVGCELSTSCLNRRPKCPLSSSKSVLIMI